MKFNMRPIVTTLSVICAFFDYAGARADSAKGPSPSPSPPPPPAVAFHGVFSESIAFSHPVNAVGSFDTPTGADRATRANFTNAFAILTKTSGTLQYALQAGAYSMPVVGVASNKTIQTGANTDLFGPVPLAFAEYVPNNRFNVGAGILATLIGVESTFTYQNWNVQRGAVWNVENAVSRGIRATWTVDKLTASLGANDGFYSGHYGAAEASLNFAPDGVDSLLFAALIPNSRTPGNQTTAIANKQLLNLVFTRTRGNLQLAPYFLWARSPAAAGLGYTCPESAFGGAFLANWTLSGRFGAAFRYESLHNASSTDDTSGNADLIGYGPGSGANTFTLTPRWSQGNTYARVDLSKIYVTNATPGLMFGSDGTHAIQFRTMLEVGVQF